MKIGKFHIRRDGIHWLSYGETVDDDGLRPLVIYHHRIPPLPATHGSTIAIEPDALVEEPKEGRPPALVEACMRVLRNAQDTDRELRRKGKRGLDFSTLQLLYVGPDDGSCDPLGGDDIDHRNTLISWRATAR